MRSVVASTLLVLVASGCGRVLATGGAAGTDPPIDSVPPTSELTESGVNLIPGSSFEVDTDENGVADDWFGANGGATNGGATNVNFSTPSGGALHGDRFQRITADYEVGAFTEVFAYLDPTAVEPGRDYSFSAHLRTSDPALRVFLRFGWVDSSGEFIVYAGNSGHTLTSSWERYSTTDNAPAGAASAFVEVIPFAESTVTGVDTDIDAVQFETGTIPGEYAPTTTGLPFDPLFPIEQGANGPVVAAIQGRLRVIVDCDFGNQTRGAVEELQAAAGIPVTGTIDELSWGLLDVPTTWGDDANGNGTIEPSEVTLVCDGEVDLPPAPRLRQPSERGGDVARIPA